MHLAGLDRQVDTLQNGFILFFKRDVQVLDLKHFFFPLTSVYFPGGSAGIPRQASSFDFDLW